MPSITCPRCNHKNRSISCDNCGKDLSGFTAINSKGQCTKCHTQPYIVCSECGARLGGMTASVGHARMEQSSVIMKVAFWGIVALVIIFFASHR